MKPKFLSAVFCADASAEAGGGHMTRCLNLARALRPICKVTFALGTDRAPRWLPRLRDEGIVVVDDADPMAIATMAVLDGYGLRQADIAEWKQRARAVVMIEDLGRCFAGIDLYISPSGPPPGSERVLAGPPYALLDARYAEPLRARPTGDVHDILISCGLRDSADVTSIYLEALSQYGVVARGMTITVVLGGAAPHLDVVRRRAKDLGARVMVDVSDMQALYDLGDLVLGVGGVSLYERLARGRPSITVVAAENQKYAARILGESKATLLAGEAGKLDADALTRAIFGLIEDRAARDEMGRVARHTVDGLGSERTASALLALAGGVAPDASAAERG